ncbi:MAG: FxLYD domain-containing protein [Nitrososphaerales archaeon]
MSTKVVGIALMAALSVSIFTYVDAFANGQVRVVGHRMSIDTAGIVHISGIVENTSTHTVGFVRVIAYLFDENGRELPTHDTYTLVRIIPPGYIAPFDIPISDQRVGKSVAFYTITLEWKTVQPKADKLVFTDLNAFVWTHLDPRTRELRDPHGDITSSHHDSHAHTEISAFVNNVSHLTTKTVKVFAIWYDEKGQYYSYNMQTVARQLAASEAGRFVIMTHPTMAYYSLIAESDDYVSMLKDNKEWMFRIYEANNDNLNLPGVDTMGLADIFVKDVADNVIHRIPIKSKPVIPHFMQVETASDPIINDNGREYQLQVRTFDNKLIDFSYEQETRTITLYMNGTSGNDRVHAEIIIPNAFNEFVSIGSFEATLNGAPLHDKLFFVDPYSYEGKTSFHYIISGDELRKLSQQMVESYLDRLVFTLVPAGADNAISVNVGEPLQIQSVVTNNIDKKQKFVYVLQVKDSNGTTVMITWIDGNIAAKESMNTTHLWIPQKKGTYTIQIFLLESLTYTSAMSRNFVDSTLVVN